ncbi:hypothetical protein EXD76_01500 [BEV proteobacterium]|nr:hypothetical protein [Candidatus Symbiopectobacterium sp. Chty_BC]
MITQIFYLFNKAQIFSQARQQPKRVVFAEGEDPCVLHATQELVTLGLAFPILIGCPGVIEKRLQKLGLQNHHW